MKQLHPGAKWLFRLRALGTVLFLVIFLGIWASAALAFFAPMAALAFIPFILIAAIIIIEVYARLSYNFWKYEFTGEQLRMERGIIWKRYSNIPYERIQNVDITRGIIARLSGFSSVHLQTAGYSMPARNQVGAWAEGFIPAVPMAEAEKIREFVLGKISKKGRRQGL